MKHESCSAYLIAWDGVVVRLPGMNNGKKQANKNNTTINNQKAATSCCHLKRCLQWSCEHEKVERRCYGFEKGSWMNPLSLSLGTTLAISPILSWQVLWITSLRYGTKWAPGVWMKANKSIREWLIHKKWAYNSIFQNTSQSEWQNMNLCKFTPP